MKTIIVVTFFGILMNAFAQESKKQGCHREAMKRFDSTKYLKMSPIYETHTEKASFPIICRVIETKQQPSEGTVDITTYGYYQYNGKMHYSEGQCTVTVQSMEGGQFSGECKITNDTLMPNPANYKDVVFTVYTSVIDTDYENYAILYRCLDIEEYGTIDNTFVLKTNKDANDAIDGLVGKALVNNGMNLKTFTPASNNTYCDNNSNMKKKI